MVVGFFIAYMCNSKILQEIIEWKKLNQCCQDTLIFCLQHNFTIGEQRCLEMIDTNNKIIQKLADSCHIKLTY
jgi:hypothetical protein